MQQVQPVEGVLPRLRLSLIRAGAQVQRLEFECVRGAVDQVIMLLPWILAALLHAQFLGPDQSSPRGVTRFGNTAALPCSISGFWRALELDDKAPASYARRGGVCGSGCALFRSAVRRSPSRSICGVAEKRVGGAVKIAPPPPHGGCLPSELPPLLMHPHASRRCTHIAQQLASEKVIPERAERAEAPMAGRN